MTEAWHEALKPACHSECEEAPLSKDEVGKLDAYCRPANDLSVGQI
jgi:hypothetical protein